MNTLTAERFAEFYEAATLAIAVREVEERRKKNPDYQPEKEPEGKSPFPWQVRVAARVCDPARGWPAAIALPTAAGKTACIDIAVFALACQAKLEKRTAPRRIFFVVDRRVVVDQAYLHAQNLAAVLKEATPGILKEVGDALKALADDARPLDVYALRGGMYREDTWVRTPLQPTVIASTVDQVGSRLLFRGYGVSDSMKPIHAGLVGNDALILLDEAHCAKPFAETADAVARYRGWNDSLAPFKFVTMTATPSRDIPADQIERDEQDDRDHEVLGKRIKASKPTKLIVAEKAKGNKWREPLVAELAKQARVLMADGFKEGFKAIGVIVNRVATARDLAGALRLPPDKNTAADQLPEVILLTGRMRPLDRDIVLNQLEPLFSGKGADVGPTFIVATQCLEVGADLDFHGLVTECASLDALRQRFGRLNRIAARPTAKAVIVIRSDHTEDTSEDPVYGESLAKTWQWLKSKATNDVFDFGVGAVRFALADKYLTSLNAPTMSAPVLLPAHLDCWVQTAPKPTPDPDPALFLHGPKQPGVPDVQVVFRADLGEDPANWAETVALCPPSSSEAMPVRINVFKNWLAGKSPTDDSADVEGGRPAEVDDEPANRRALYWAGADDELTCMAKVVRPNRTYVVSMAEADLESLGDFPPSAGRLDYADAAFQRSRDRAMLRLTPKAIEQWPHCFPKADALAVANAGVQEDDEEFDGRLKTFLKLIGRTELPGELRSAWEWLTRAGAELANDGRRVVEPHPAGGLIVTGKRRLRQFDPTFADDESSESPTHRMVTLEHHTCGVVGYADRFSRGCGLGGLVPQFLTAARWHDLGKADPRFQAMLQGRSPRTARPPILAKSGMAYKRKHEREAAQAVHRFPKGGRHEVLSVAAGAAKTDDCLILHLIASHHGHAHPFAPAMGDAVSVPAPFTLPFLGESFDISPAALDPATANTTVPQRFWRIVRTHGWWGSAYLEAVFRLADHAASRAEQEEDYDATKIPVVPPPKAPLPAGPQTWASLSLPGLDGSNPLSFLAAVGVFRLAHQAFDGMAKMSWKQAGCWQPVLHLPQGVTADSLVDELHRRVHRTADPAASKRAEKLYDAYRGQLKLAEAAMKTIKERKLRGAERAAAIKIKVTPLSVAADSARRAWLETRKAAVAAPFLALGKALSVTAEEFRVFAAQVAERLYADGPAGRSDADFASAFGCEVCVLDTGRITPTEFQLITGSGHQFFLETLRTLMETVTANQIKRAIFGPWTYSDPRLSFRWDPLEDRRYAYGWGDPSGSEVRTEHGANLLAAFALPTFPLIPTARGPGTTGFNARLDSPAFTWPVWTPPLTVDVLRSLVAAAGLQQDPVNRAELRLLGVADVFRTRKIEVGRPPLSKLNLTTAITV